MSTRETPRGRWILAMVLVVPLAASWPMARSFAAIARDYGLEGALDVVRRRVAGGSGPAVAWELSTPEAADLSRPELDSLRETLASRGTHAFLLARAGKLVYEWYDSTSSPNTLYGTAALAKAVVGTMALLALAADRVVLLDDRASDYVHDWRTRGDMAGITLGQLASHTSGLDDVYFPTPQETDATLQEMPAWQRRYFENPDQRFDLAIAETPLVFEPGTAYRYSGAGYYVLAYALASALGARTGDDLRHWLATRVYRPLGIPLDAWQISYGQGYAQDGLSLYALGSGGAFTGRALARIGQAVLDHWNEAAFAPLHAAAESTHSGGNAGRAIPHLGWWGNERGAWTSLPSDAIVGLGADDQVLLVVPSLRLVAVRCGRSLSDGRPTDVDAHLEDALFAPLAHALR